MKVKRFYKITPYLPVIDLKETLAFYRDKLGFSGEWMADAPLPVGGIRRDDLRLLFQQHPAYTKMVNTDSESFELLLFVDNVDDIYEECRAKDIHFISGLVDRPWGIREFIIQDINGYWLRVSEGDSIG